MTRIGASDVPAIMGTCDFNNAQSVWEVKTGLKEPFKGNWATQRGHDLEPIARELYEEKFNVKAPATFVKNKDWEILTSSLDGWTGERVVEFKAPSKSKHQMAIDGIVPTTYRDQLQTQMLCAGVDVAHYVSFDPDDGIAVVEVIADKERQKLILSTCMAFWDLVLTKTPPNGGEIEQPELEVVFLALKQTREKLKQLENEEKTYLDKIKESMRAERIKCGEFTAQWSTRKGNVNYKDIPELKNVDLEKYRGKETRVFTAK